MDPNVTLAEIRVLVRKILAGDSWNQDAAADGLQLAEKVEDLNTWMSNGGSLPSDWR